MATKSTRKRRFTGTTSYSDRGLCPRSFGCCHRGDSWLITRWSYCESPAAICRSWTSLRLHRSRSSTPCTSDYSHTDLWIQWILDLWCRRGSMVEPWPWRTPAIRRWSKWWWRIGLAPSRCGPRPFNSRPTTSARTLGSLSRGRYFCTRLRTLCQPRRVGNVRPRSHCGARPVGGRDRSPGGSWSRCI